MFVPIFPWVKTLGVWPFFHEPHGTFEVLLAYCPSDDDVDLQLVFACHKGDVSTLERLLKAPRDPHVRFETLGKLGAKKEGNLGMSCVSMYVCVCVCMGIYDIYIYIYI